MECEFHARRVKRNARAVARFLDHEEIDAFTYITSKIERCARSEFGRKRLQRREWKRANVDARRDQRGIEDEVAIRTKQRTRIHDRVHARLSRIRDACD